MGSQLPSTMSLRPSWQIIDVYSSFTSDRRAHDGMPHRATSILINDPIRALISVQRVGLPRFVTSSQFDILLITKKDHAFFHDLMVLERYRFGGVTSRSTSA